VKRGLLQPLSIGASIRPARRIIAVLVACCLLCIGSAGAAASSPGTPVAENPPNPWHGKIVSDSKKTVDDGHGVVWTTAVHMEVQLLDGQATVHFSGDQTGGWTQPLSTVECQNDEPDVDVLLHSHEPRWGGGTDPRISGSAMAHYENAHGPLPFALYVGPGPDSLWHTQAPDGAAPPICHVVRDEDSTLLQLEHP
jgi:hypothetical protein